MAIVIQVQGKPRPQGSKRLVNGRMIEASAGLPAWRESIRAETQRAMNGNRVMGGAVRAELVFLMPRPKGHMGVKGIRKGAPALPTIVPDLDKLARAVLDGIVNGGAIQDDSQVTTLVAKKVYADDRVAGLIVRLSEDE